MPEDKYAKRTEALKKAILKAVESAPAIKGLTATQAADKLDIPEPTAYVYMEKLVAAELLGYTTIGKSKIYSLKRK